MIEFADIATQLQALWERGGLKEWFHENLGRIFVTAVILAVFGYYLNCLFKAVRRWCNRVKRWWNGLWFRKKKQPQHRSPKVKPMNAPFQVHFIDVEHGDSALVMCNGHNMLIDGGGVQTVVRDYLNDCGIKKLDIVVGTHEHSDHVAGLKIALKGIKIDRVYAPATSYRDNESFNNFVRFVREQGKKITVPKPGTSLSFGDANLRVLGPLHSYKSTPECDENEHSIVMRLEYGNNSFLFTGDIQHQAEHDIVASRAHLQSDVLKVAHHGSATSSDLSFLQRVRPEYAVISTDNKPYHGTLSSLKAVNAKVLRTDLHGHVVFYGNKQGMKVKCSKGQIAV